MDLSMTHTLLRMYLVTLAKADSLETPTNLYIQSLNTSIFLQINQTKLRKTINSKYRVVLKKYSRNMSKI